MAITPRTQKDGSLVYEISYTMTDPSTGKRKYYSERWHPKKGSSAKVTEREAKKEEGVFIERCKRGEVLTKKEQKQQQKEQAEQAERERLERESKPTYKEYTKTFLDRLATVEKCAEGSISTYSLTLEKAFPLFGEMKLEDITETMLRKYVNDLNGEYAYNTARSHFVTLDHLFKMAVEDGILTVSPMDRIKPPKKGKDEPEKQKVLDEDTMRYLMNCLNQESPMWKAYVTFMSDTGCRRGETTGLKWESVDLTKGRVLICNNRQYTPGKGVHDVKPKTGKSRLIPISERTVLVLKAWKKEQMEYSFQKGIPQPEYCFTVKGQAMNPCSVNGYFKKLGEKTGIPNLHPHMLRHTNITISLANGADITSVSKKAGHSNIATTLNIYSHASEDSMRRAVAKYDEVIYGEEEQKKAQ